MNKKQIILILLLLAIKVTFTIQPAMAVEMTWPLSALLWVSNIPVSTLKKNTQNASIYYMLGSYKPGSLPQCEGYYASTDPFDIALQIGVNAGIGHISNALNNTGNNGVENKILYFSDMIRACRNKPPGPFEGFGGWNSKVFCTNKTMMSSPGPIRERIGVIPCPKGPRSASFRGSSNASATDTFDGIVAWITSQWYNNINVFMAAAKKTIFLNTPSITLTSASFTPVNGEANSYYFALTGADVYLPLHMISPGEHLLATDPNYLNFGPTPENVNTPQDGGGWLPWSYGYMPAHIPQQKLKTTVF